MQPAGPKCYSCSAPATTRCQSCGALSCAQHLQSIYVSHNEGGAYELRCESCHSSAVDSNFFNRWILPILVIIVYVIVGFAILSHR
jgi:hypothetical protein